MELTSDPILIGRTAWELMRTLACPPEELRGIGLQMQKLENATSTTVSAAGVEGQARLSFQTVNKGKSRPSEGSIEVVKNIQHLPPHTPIVIGESSSPQVTVERIPGRPGRTRSTRSRQPVNYIDLATSESDGAGDQDGDLTILSQAPLHLKEAGQSLFGGRVTKRSASGSLLHKTKAIVIPATSPAAVVADPITAIVSPSKLTDKNLFTLGLDSNFFQSCSRKTQVALLKEVLAKRGDDNEEIRNMLVIEKVRKGKKKKKKPLFAPVFEQAAENAAKREEARLREQKKRERLARGPVFYKLDLPSVNKAPAFANQSEASDVCRILSQWMEGVGLDHAPALEEVHEFSKFCLASISADPAENGGKGADTAKICIILQWWDRLICQRERSDATSGSRRAATAAWRDAQATVRRKVDENVEKEWGAPLSVSF
jgi:DNA repair protein REV1